MVGIWGFRQKVLQSLTSGHVIGNPRRWTPDRIGTVCVLPRWKRGGEKSKTLQHLSPRAPRARRPMLLMLLYVLMLY